MVTAEQKAAAGGRFIWPQPPGQCLIDDGYRRTLRPIGDAEIAAFEQGDSHRVEITRTRRS